MSEMPRYQCHICNCVVEAPTESPPICTGPRQYDPQVGGPVRHFRTIMDRVDNDSSTGTHEHRLASLERQLEVIKRAIHDQPTAVAWQGYTDMLQRQIDQLAHRHDIALGNHAERIEKLEPRFGNPSYYLDDEDQEDDSDHRLADRLSRLEESVLGAHANRIDALESRADGHTKRIGELELAKSGPAGTDLWERLSRIERDFGGLQDRMETALDHHHNRLRKLERKGSE